MTFQRFLAILSYLVTFSLGVIGLAKILSVFLTRELQPVIPYPVNRYLLPFFWNSEKPFELSQYCLTVAFLTAYACITSLFVFSPGVQRRIEHFTASTPRPILGGFLTVSVVLNLALGIASCKMDMTTPYIAAYSTALFPWILMLLWPVFSSPDPARPSGSSAVLPLRRNVDRMAAVAIILIFCDLVWILSPFLFEPLRLIDEFRDLPSTTILKKNSESLDAGRHLLEHPLEVNTASYAKEHRLIGPDPEAIGAFVDVVPSPALEPLCEKSDSCFFDRANSRLVLLQPLAADELSSLRNALDTEAERIALERAQLAESHYWLQESLRLYTPQEIEFMKSNQMELHWQTLNRWMLHHHNFMLSPMSDLAMGRPVSESYFQYGFLNCWVMEKLCLLLHGQVSYQAYQPIYYSFYLVYFLEIVLFAWLVFRRPVLCVMIGCCAFISVAVIGFQLLQLGPGSNPIRHLLDLPVAYCVWTALGVTWGRRTQLWFLAAYLIALVEVAGSREFGCFLVLAVLTVQSLLLFSRRIPLLVVIGIACLGLLGLFAVLQATSVGTAGETQYYLLGLLGFPSSQKFMLITASLCSLYLLTTFLIIRISAFSAEGLMALFFALYSMQLDTYYVWNRIFDHLMSVFILHILSVAFLMIAILRIWTLQQRLARLLLWLGAISCAVLVCMVTFVYKMEERHYDSDFTTHKTYAWEFPRVRAISTMDPAPFAASIQTITERSPDPGIWIISRYDMILPFLAGKYSNMAYFEIGNFMITTKEKLQVVRKIEDARPPVLFVDSDIEKNFRADIIPPFCAVIGYLHDESYWRAERLELIQSVWDAVKSSYRLESAGPMISVWVRKD